MLNPFTIIVDTGEQHPFTFGNIDGFDIRTRRLSLGASRGDYSVVGLEGFAHVERKSMDDAHGTLLRQGAKLERFFRELATLGEMRYSAVVIECSKRALLFNVPSHGIKTEEQNRATIEGRIRAMQMDYRVPWIFCESRRDAEVETFKILKRAWKYRTQS